MEEEWNSCFNQRRHFWLFQLLHWPRAQSPSPLLALLHFVVLCPVGPTALEGGWSPSELNSCIMSDLLSNFTSVWIAATSALLEAIYLFKVTVEFPIAVGPWALTGVSHFVQCAAETLDTNANANVAPHYTEVSGLVYLQEELRNSFAFKNRTTWTDNPFFDLSCLN